MNYQEGTKYKLQADYYESSFLTCTWVTYTTVYFKLDSDDQSLGSDYRLDIKSKKLHKWNSKYMSWDNIENTLSEHSAEDIWSKRTGNHGGDYYSGINGQGD
jgi:hypothetical protein